MGENFIHIDNIVFDRNAKPGQIGIGASVHMNLDGANKFAVIAIPGMRHRSVIGVLSTLLRHMEIDPLEIFLYRASHDGSRDHSHGIAVWPEALRRAAELGAKGNDNPSVSGGAADSSLCTREPLEGEE